MSRCREIDSIELLSYQTEELQGRNYCWPIRRVLGCRKIRWIDDTLGRQVAIMYSDSQRRLLCTNSKCEKLLVNMSPQVRGNNLH